jgi:hypothetical protein
MAIALRCIAIAALGLFLLPAVASADGTVARDAVTGIITITDDAFGDKITVGENPTQTSIQIGAGALHTTTCAGDNTQQILCTRATSISADMGDGGDTLDARGVSVPVSMFGGLGIDTLTGGSGPDVLAGGDQSDILNGLGGVDDYFGGTGDDSIEATDGNAERISCGAGIDSVHNDFTDVIAECETGIDFDGDGFSSAVDCNDAIAAIFPGAREIFSNGIDEDCNGRDDVNLDVDGDGFPRPADCNDNDPKIRPNAVEIRGNKVDENCDRVASPWLRLPAVVSNRWAVGPNFTLLRALILHNLPRGARIVFSCDGGSCPFRKTKRQTVRSTRPITLSRGLTGKRLRAGTRFRLAITASQTIGRTYKYTIRNGALPSDETRCKAPGEKGRGRPC